MLFATTWDPAFIYVLNDSGWEAVCDLDDYIPVHIDSFAVYNDTLYAGTAVPGWIYATQLRIYMETDLNKDGKVNIQDLFIVAKAFGSHGPDIPNPGDLASEKWNPVADVTKDGWVNIRDLYEVAKDYGKTL